MVFDPGDVVLKTLKLEKPRPLWTPPAGGGAPGHRPRDRGGALPRARAGLASRALAEALARRSLLGGARGGRARAGANPARRRARARFWRRSATRTRACGARWRPALGEYRGDERAGEALARWAAAGRPQLLRRGRGGAGARAHAHAARADVLPTLLGRSSFQDVIRSARHRGRWARPATSAPSRSSRGSGGPAARLCAARRRHGDGRAWHGTAHARQARGVHRGLLSDPDFRVRGEAASSLARVVGGSGAGDRTRARGGARRARAAAHGRAIRELHERPPAEQVKKLQDEVDPCARRLQSCASGWIGWTRKVPAAAPPAPPPPSPPPSGEISRPRRRAGRGR